MGPTCTAPRAGTVCTAYEYHFVANGDRLFTACAGQALRFAPFTLTCRLVLTLKQ